MSDLADANASREASKFYKIAARNSAALVIRIAEQLGSGRSRSNGE